MNDDKIPAHCRVHWKNYSELTNTEESLSKSILFCWKKYENCKNKREREREQEGGRVLQSSHAIESFLLQYANHKVVQKGEEGSMMEK